ncbi:MAG TPA: hypothetical protein PLV68_21700, partial [Ilumatobacteraceae bacterium]|nr:hypothetical protein [Ilumatobacteraceae bacterium]
MDADLPASNPPGGSHAIPLPPPPPAPDPSVTLADPTVADPFAWTPPPLRAGQLAPSWRTTFLIGWVLVVAALGCMWQVSRQIGLATWWLGPETDQRSWLVIAIPFVGPAATLAAGAWNRTWAVHLGIVVSLITGVIAFGDREYPGLMIGEGIVALSALAI